jgi:hypothetical protein
MATAAIIEIEKGVPIPPPKGGAVKYPFADMEIGDSFAAPGVPDRTLRPQVSKANTRFPGRRFVCRAIGGLLRVWRVA